MPRGIYSNIECDIGKHPPFTAQKHQEHGAKPPEISYCARVSEACYNSR